MKTYEQFQRQFGMQVRTYDIIKGFQKETSGPVSIPLTNPLLKILGQK